MMWNATVLILAALAGFQQTSPFRTHTTATFRIRSEKSVPQADTRRLGKALEAASAVAKRKFQTSLGIPTQVVVYSSRGRFKAESGSRAFDDGDVQGGTLYVAITEETKAEGRLEAIASRLVAKAVLERLPGCPRWLAEAYALHAGGDTVRFGMPADVHVKGFEDLAEEYSRLDVRKVTQEVYAKLASAIRFLVGRYGQKPVEAALLKFRESADLGQVFESTLGEKLPDIERAWVASLRSPGPSR